MHYMARFISGFAVGFTSVWQLTLVTVAVVPLIAIAGGSYAVVMIGLTSRSQKAYSKAGEIAEEVCSDFQSHTYYIITTNDIDSSFPELGSYKSPPR